MEVKASFSARETDDPTPGNRETCYLLLVFPCVL